jgi:hypothetical protein
MTPACPLNRPGPSQTVGGAGLCFMEYLPTKAKRYLAVFQGTEKRLSWSSESQKKEYATLTQLHLYFKISLADTPSVTSAEQAFCKAYPILPHV